MTLKVLSNDNEVFQCGVSVAPVTDWIFYGYNIVLIQ